MAENESEALYKKSKELIEKWPEIIRNLQKKRIKKKVKKMAKMDPKRDLKTNQKKGSKIC